jgi:hypothetical protein
MSFIGRHSAKMKSNFEETTRKLILAARRGEDAQASALIPIYLGLLEAQMAGMGQEERGKVEAMLPELLKAQMDGDWVRFADLVEGGR